MATPANGQLRRREADYDDSGVIDPKGNLTATVEGGFLSVSHATETTRVDVLAESVTDIKV